MELASYVHSGKYLISGSDFIQLCVVLVQRG